MKRSQVKLTNHAGLMDVDGMEGANVMNDRGRQHCCVLDPYEVGSEQVSKNGTYAIELKPGLHHRN